VSRVAREFGFKSRVFVGGTSMDRIVSNPIQYPLMNNILAVGGELDTSASRGYQVLLDYEARKWSEINGGFHVKFGINLHEYSDAIVGSVSRQVQNLPDDLDALVVPVGSGIMFSGIVRGIVKYGKRVKNLIGIQISGKDLRKNIDEMTGTEWSRPYELEILKGIRYATPMKLSYGGIDFDWLYEGKAFWYMQSKLPKLNGKRVCFWIVGNSTKVRT
jgi:hypothetical protein